MARQVLDNGVILPSEYSDDWYEDMSTNLEKLDEVIGSDAGKLSEADVSNVALSGDYDDLTDKPELKPVATSGDYDDLTNKPSYGILRMTSETLSDSGSGAISNLNSDSKLAAGDYVLDAALKVFPITAVSAPNYTVGTSLFQITNASALAAVATSGSYDDLNNLPTYGITRFVNAAITDNSNVAFSNISSVDKIKAGDFLLDNAGKMYLIASVDSVNETAAVTTPLTQLAIDSNVVHTSGNETVGGSKTFTWPITITSYPCIRMYLSDDEWNVQPASAKQSEIRFTDKNAVLISYITFQHRTDANEPFRTCWRQQKMDGTSGYFSVNFNNLGEFYPENYNSIKLGKPNNRWLGVYAMNYYYGANDVEFSTKFVTSDTTQTISGSKVFSSTPNIYNSDTSGTTANLYLRNQLVTKGDTSSAGNQTIRFADANDKIIGRIQSNKISNGASSINLRADSIDTSNNDVIVEVQILAGRDGTKSFSPQLNNDVNLGRSLAKWKNIYSNQINELEPSSLSLPANKANSIDISGYFTQMGSGNTNVYDVPANGYIYMQLANIATMHCFAFEDSSTTIATYIQTFSRGNDGQLYVLFPVRKSDVFKGTWYTTTTVTVNKAVFIPCQGNI